MTVEFSQKGAVGTLTINRPERRNALDSETLQLFVENLDVIANLDTVSVLIITGAGDKCFCAGGDLTSIAGSSFIDQHNGRSGYLELLQAMDRFPKPSIARINGLVRGGGLGLTLACDMVVSREDTDFGTPEIKLGLFPMMVMALMLRNMPRKKAMELMFSGGKVSANEARDLGMINQVVPASELDSAVNALADRIAGYSPAILKLGKDAWGNMQGMPYRESLQYLHGMLTLAVNTEDAMEGISAFLGKRTPEWKGK
jgi:enoyl-CoA hydratase